MVGQTRPEPQIVERARAFAAVGHGVRDGHVTTLKTVANRRKLRLQLSLMSVQSNKSLARL
jgi:hypothetical protein